MGCVQEATQSKNDCTELKYVILNKSSELKVIKFDIRHVCSNIEQTIFYMDKSYMGEPNYWYDIVKYLQVGDTIDFTLYSHSIHRFK